MDLEIILRAAMEMGASDVHLSTKLPALVRCGGKIMQLPGSPRPLEDAVLTTWFTELMAQEQRQRLAEQLDVDFSFTLQGGGRFRANIHLHNLGIGGVFRLIPEKIPTPDQLTLPPALMRLVHLPRGLVLVTGPTGSGKTTTLACLVQEILQVSQKHVLTIEDPIEFIYPSARSRVTQREVGRQARSFATALRAALRQDPDVILVGEMRDPETIALALTAAETGHLVLSTLHTSGAARSLHRILDAFEPNHQPQIRAQLATTLQAVVTQTLVPRADGEGRVAAREVLVQTLGISNMIREHQVHQIGNALYAGAAMGMCTLDQDLARLVREEMITLEDAKVHSADLEELARLTRQAWK